MSVEIDKVVEGLNRAFKEFKDANDERLAKLEKGQGTAEVEAKLTKLEETIASSEKELKRLEDEKKVLADRLERLEAEADDVGPGKDRSKERLAQEHVKAFEAWIRGRGRNYDAQKHLQEVEKKAVTGISDSGGASAGHAVPEEISREIDRVVQLTSPVRQAVKVVRAGSPDFKELLDIRGATTGWVGETDSRSATNTPQLLQRAPTFGTLYAYPAAYEETLNDVFFDVSRWLVDSISDGFALAEGVAVLTGNGTNKPTGMLDEAPVSTADDASPLRDPAALQYVPIGIESSPLTAAISADGLISLIYTLKAQHRAAARFAMASTTIAAVRKLKDSYGQYLWQPALAAGQPPTLLGYPVLTWENLASPAVNGLSVLFGDFRRGYTLVDLQGMRMTVDDNITAPGQVKFYVRRRMGGCVYNHQAIKVGKISPT